MEQPSKRSAWPAVVLVVVVLVVTAGGIVALLAAGDDADDPAAEETGGDDLDFPAIDERYRSLGRTVTAGASECTEAEAAAGATEQVVCTTPEGTLTLTTYSSEDAVTATRADVLDHAAGTIVADVPSGAFYAHDPSIADKDSSDPAVVYWDSPPGRQTALLTGGDGVGAEDLLEVFAATEPMVTVPSDPADPRVTDLVARFDIDRCRRVPTSVPGVTEESRCVRSGRRTLVAQFAASGDFTRHRDELFRLARADRFPVRDFWYVDANANDRRDEQEPERGRVYGHVDERNGDAAVLYLDDTECRCYLLMRGEKRDDPKILYELLFPAPQPSG